MSPRKSLVLAAVLALSAPALFAKNWKTELNNVYRDLRTEHYAHARKWSIKVINSMSDHLGTGEAASYSLALAVAYRALAEQGLDKPDDADWYWHVATSMYPAIAKRDWSEYGDPGKWAAKHTDDIEADEGTVVPIKKVDQQCPLAAVQGAYYQPIHVSAIVDKDGNPRCPARRSHTQAPTLEYAAFKALRQWQFQTATVAKYDVTVDFQPPKQ